MNPAALAGREIRFQEARDIQVYPRIYHVYPWKHLPWIYIDMSCKKKKKVLASFKPPNWQRAKARFVRRGWGRVRTQDLGHRSGCADHCSTRPGESNPKKMTPIPVLSISSHNRHASEFLGMGGAWFWWSSRALTPPTLPPSPSSSLPTSPSASIPCGVHLQGPTGVVSLDFSCVYFRFFLCIF